MKQSKKLMRVKLYHSASGGKTYLIVGLSICMNMALSSLACAMGLLSCMLSPKEYIFSNKLANLVELKVF